MRIVGGRLRGRMLAAPKSHATRPTSDKVRESIFNVILHSADAPPLDGAKVIDLFAGTGALGLEAISRGAAYALFVEESSAARALIRENVEAFGLQGVTRIFRRDATRLGPAGNRDRYTFAFLDPPYAKGLGERALTALSSGNWLAPGAMVLIEESASVSIGWPASFHPFDTRAYGDTAVHFARWTGPDSPATNEEKDAEATADNDAESGSGAAAP